MHSIKSWTRLSLITLGILFLFFLTTSCTKKSSETEIWIYTSLYKDFIADLEPQLKAAYPDISFKFFQAGSEEVSAKVNAENLAGGTKADILMFSDPFWFEEMAQKGSFIAYQPKGSENVPKEFRHPENFYRAVSLPSMILMYNSEAITETEAPKSFKDLADAKWKKKFATGSPLSSGTNFTTVALLQKAYGWDYFKALHKNETISEGGSSSVIRRIQTKERPVGWVLLENALRVVDADKKLKIIYPEDGMVLQTNMLAITKKKGSREAVQKIADFMYTTAGQNLMTKYFMYSPLPGFETPKGAKKLDELYSKAKKFDHDILKSMMGEREKIKEEFAKIMFN